MEELQALDWNAVFMDALIVGIVLCAGIVHWKRGFYNTCMPVAVVILSLGVGIAGQAIFAEPIADNIIQPMVERSINDKIERVHEQNLSDDYVTPQEVLSREVDRLIRSLGLEQDVAEGLSSAQQEAIVIAEDAMVGATMGVAMKVIRLVLMGAFAGLGFLVFTMIKNFVGKVSDWPVIRLVDSAGGFALGIVEALIVLCVCLRLADFFGIEYFHYVSEGTKVFSMLAGESAAEVAQDYINQGLYAEVTPGAIQDLVIDK